MIQQKCDFFVILWCTSTPNITLITPGQKTGTLQRARGFYAAEGDDRPLIRSTSPLAAGETRTRIYKLAFLKAPRTKMSDGPKSMVQPLL
jgi:hypothetical protein